MHEWGIATNIIEKIRKYAIMNKLKKVTLAEITLGKGLHIGLDEFRACLVALAKDDCVSACTFEIKEDDSKLARLELLEGE